MLFVKKKKSTMAYSNFIVSLLFRAGFLCKVLAALKLEIILSLPPSVDLKGVCHVPNYSGISIFTLIKPLLEIILLHTV